MSDTISTNEMLRDMIRAERDGAGLARATEAVARACQITYRRARAIWNDEARRLWADEEARIREAFVARMERKIHQLEAQQALVRARIEAARSSHETLDGCIRSVAGGTIPRTERVDAGPV